MKNRQKREEQSTQKVTKITIDENRQKKEERPKVTKITIGEKSSQSNSKQVHRKDQKVISFNDSRKLSSAEQKMKLQKILNQFIDLTLSSDDDGDGGGDD